MYRPDLSVGAWFPNAFVSTHFVVFGCFGVMVGSGFDACNAVVDFIFIVA